jgi:tripartite-type tricarboxylate transporter receptor subunit TctC
LKKNITWEEKMRTFAAAACGLIIAICGIAPAKTQTSDDFYRGKTLNIIVGYGPGGGYDLYARILSRYMGKYIPGNPTIAVQNMPGAGSLRAANHLYNVAAKDGTVVGTFDMNVPLLGIVGDKNALFDARKFSWLGSLSNFSADAYVLWARKDGPVADAAGLLKPDGHVMQVGVVAAGASDYDLGIMLSEDFGMRLRMVTGYPSSSAIGLALDKGESDGQFVTYLSSRIIKKDWGVPGSNIQVILQFGRSTRHPTLQNVPLVSEFAKTDFQRQLIAVSEAPFRLSRPYVGPPGIPAERLKMLRDAFDQAAKDQGLLSEAEKINLEISPVPGPQAEREIEDLTKSPPAVLKRLLQLREKVTK